MEESTSSSDEMEEIQQIDKERQPDIPISTAKEEAKQLRKQIIELRRMAQRTDKQHKKALQEQIRQLETKLEDICSVEENEQLRSKAVAEAQRQAEMQSKRMAKEQKRREKEQGQREEAEAFAAQLPKLGQTEQALFKEMLDKLGLLIYNIEPDGSCLFNAIAHQLQIRQDRHLSQADLRRLAAEHIESNASKYAGFLEEPVNEYSTKLRETDLWGGHFELDALAQVLQTQIIVYQSDCDPIRFGPENDRAPLLLCFQKYAYSLGEHYDSLISIDKSPDQSPKFYSPIHP